MLPISNVFFSGWGRKVVDLVCPCPKVLTRS